MTTGFMWLDDNDGRPLVDRLQEAAGYHLRRYGYWPNRCEVPAGTVSDLQHMELVPIGRTITLVPVCCLPERHWFLYRQEDGS